MSTPFRVHVAFCAGLLSVACSGGAPDAVRASYAGLDAPLGSELRPPIVVGILADTTGPDGAAGRAFCDVLRARLEAASPLRERLVQVHVFDDRGAAEGVRGAASRLESDPGVLVAIVRPGLSRARTAAELAYRTNVVCAGCAGDEVPREGSFALAGPGDAAEATAAWIVAALGHVTSFDAAGVRAALRGVDPPRPYARAEGSAPPRDPSVFRPPSQPEKR